MTSSSSEAAVARLPQRWPEHPEVCQLTEALLAEIIGETFASDATVTVLHVARSRSLKSDRVKGKLSTTITN